MKNYLIVFLMLLSMLVNGQDWRNIKNGHFIHSDGYVDQPYVAVLEDGSWFCVYTTNDTHEGSGGQHIACRISKDNGVTWSEEVKIEQPGPESKSWGMPYQTSYGRLYVFYVFNGDKIHSLGDRSNIREDMLGWYCYRYSDDEGKSWSQRYRIPLRKTQIDRMNQWNGDVQIFWGVGKPIDLDGGMMFGFSKVGEYMLEISEGWYIYSDNINNEKNPEKVNWELLPEGDKGVRLTTGGDIQEEHDMQTLSDGKLITVWRTTKGFPLTAYSSDNGVSWSEPEIPLNYLGKTLKNPRANLKIWEVDGKYLLWFHHNSTRWFNGRNPAWIAGGMEKDGKLIWTQPELLLYDEIPNTRMSYPDIIAGKDSIWITETQKSVARTHAIPREFFEDLWSQFTIENPVDDKTAFHTTDTKDTVKMDVSMGEGVTINFKIKNDIQTQKGAILATLELDSGGVLQIKKGEYESLAIAYLNNGEEWILESDRDKIATRTRRVQDINIVFDNQPGIVSFYIDGEMSDGGDVKPFGWGRLKLDSETRIIKYVPGNARIDIEDFAVYSRPFKTTEVVGNYRHFRKNSLEEY